MLFLIIGAVLLGIAILLLGITMATFDSSPGEKLIPWIAMAASSGGVLFVIGVFQLVLEAIKS